MPSALARAAWVRPRSSRKRRSLTHTRAFATDVRVRLHKRCKIVVQAPQTSTHPGPTGPVTFSASCKGTYPLSLGRTAHDVPHGTMAPRRSPGKTATGGGPCQRTQPEGEHVGDAIPGLDQAPTTHHSLIPWVSEIAALAQPARVHWCDGSPQEWEELTGLLVKQGTLTPLNPDLRPGSFAARSDPSDVARVEDRTFICSEKEEDAGPTNNWIAP